MSNNDAFVTCNNNTTNKNNNIQSKEASGSFTANKLNNQINSNNSNNNYRSYSCVHNRHSMDLSAASSINYYATPQHTPIRFNDKYLNKSYRAERLLRISERSPELRKPLHLLGNTGSSGSLTRTKSFNPALLSNTVSFRKYFFVYIYIYIFVAASFSAHNLTEGD